ncbi:MAG TPA: hypothetical protein VEL07_22620, partial [Planctomycetota bacterium]|nr:hypothetical protein [Planctomycetota bacterium]
MTGWRRAVASARRAMIVGCTSAALLLAAPFMWAWATHRAAAGQVLEVFLTPLGEGRVQVSVLYDFEVDVADGREHVLGWRLADTWCRPIDDPVVAIDAAIAYARLRPSGERGTRGRVQAMAPSGIGEVC